MIKFCSVKCFLQMMSDYSTDKANLYLPVWKHKFPLFFHFLSLHRAYHVTKLSSLYSQKDAVSVLLIHRGAVLRCLSQRTLLLFVGEAFSISLISMSSKWIDILGKWPFSIYTFSFSSDITPTFSMWYQLSLLSLELCFDYCDFKQNDITRRHLSGTGDGHWVRPS